MGIFSRSWHLTKVSFGVIKQDKEMLLFPFVSGLFSLIFAVAMLFPTVLFEFVKQGSTRSLAFGVIDYVLLFVAYLGLAFISTFFSVCVVFTTKTRFEGGDATFFDSIKFAFTKLHLILGWSVVSATVGLLLHALDNVAQNAGVFGKIILGIVRAVIGAMWSIVTIFVIPAMVYHDLGPIDAIKKSAQTLRATWGESLVRHYGLGLVQFLFLLLGVGIAFGLFMVLAPVGTAGVAIAATLSVTYFLAVILVFSVANNVFNTALYAHANGARSAFDHQTLSSAFRTT
jgi:hypothetical protein